MRLRADFSDLTIVVLVIGTGVMYLAGYLCYGVLPYSPPMMIAPIPLVLAIINFLPLPIMLFELLVAFIQATVFMMLTITYISSAEGEH